MTTLARVDRMLARRFQPPKGWGGVVWLALVCLVVYAPTLRFPLLAWDDQLNISSNPLYHPLGWHSLIRVWQGPWFGVYAPVTYTFWGAEIWLANLGSAAAGPGSPTPVAELLHAGNLVLHLLNVWAVLKLLELLGADRKASFWGAALFAVHPLHVESVAWVTETKGLLAALGSTLALLCFARASQPQSAANDRPARSSGHWMLLATLAAAMALGSKPSAAGLPLAVLALAWAGIHPQSWRWLVWPALWALLALGLAWITRAEQPLRPDQANLGWLDRALVACDALAFYAGKLFWPWPLAPDYGRSPTMVVAAGWWWGAALVPLGLAAILCLRPIRHGWGPPLALLLAGLLPTLGLVPFEFQRFSTVADRYVYWPLLGAAWITARLISTPDGKNSPTGGWLNPRAGVAAILLAASMLVSMWQLPAWSSDRALYQHTARVNPRSSLALNGLGNLAAESGNLDQAEEFYRRLLEIDPRNAAAWFNLATVAERRDQLPLAIEYLEHCVRWEPGYVKAWRRLAQLLLASGRGPQATSTLETLLVQFPDDGELHSQLAQALQEQGRGLEAVPHLLASAQLQPALAGPANDLAWTLATDADPRVRQTQQAGHWAKAALERSGRPTANLLDTLAASQAAANQFDEAIATARQAEALAIAEGNPSLARRIAERIALYQTGQPYLAPARPNASTSAPVSP